MTKKLLCALLSCALLLSMLAMPAMAEDKPVTLEIVASQPEYLAQEQEIWALYTEEHPNVTINMITVNEDTEAAFNTRVAAGDAPDLQLYTTVDKNNYEIYQNLNDIEYAYWDLLPESIKTDFATTCGTDPSFMPCLYPYAGVTFSFIYHEDIMNDAGLNPRETVRSMEDLDKFLADLKVYADANGYASTLDAGWHLWCVFSQELDDLAIAMGASRDDLADLWLNQKIAWNDLENNPYVPAFEKLKEWYDLGYLPEKWWTRAWENDYEAGFAAKRSILAYHGPWLWTKVETIDPSAQLAGFCFPANEDGVILNGAAAATKGTVLFACNKDGENQEEAVKAFNWWNSPEIVKIRAEAFGEVTTMDMSSVGSPDLVGSQYNSVIRPIQEGFFGENVEFDGSPWPRDLAAAYRNKDGQDVTAADDMATNYGDYFEGKITIEQLMDICQSRFEQYYTFE